MSGCHEVGGGCAGHTCGSSCGLMLDEEAIEALLDPEARVRAEVVQMHERALARRVIEYARTMVLAHLRYLDAAYFKLEPLEAQTGTLSTDAEHLLYNPSYVIDLFADEHQRVVRDVLHVVLHCVFHHPFVGRPVNPLYWDLACDIAVEAQIGELGLASAECKRVAEQRMIIEKLEKQVSSLTAEKLYHCFNTGMYTEVQIREIKSVFAADEHAGWYSAPDKPTKEKVEDKRVSEKDKTSSEQGQTNEDQQRVEDDGGTEEDSDSNESGTGAAGAGGSPRESDSASGSSSDEGSSGDSDAPSDSGEKPGGTSGLGDKENLWRQISERIEVDLETLSREQGLAAAGLMGRLARVNREKYDYSAFLRRFAESGEVMQVNDDEFDYVYYTYGLRLYERMPLVEPLEYKDVKRVREFVIALDTSASTGLDLVRSFVEKTYSMLMQSESFFTKVNIHIIQCDMDIQQRTKITCADEFAAYIDNLRVRGLGGTDFRPVFEYVDRLVERGEFSHLGGLIYFTDGFGIYPEHQPDYKTAFVFLEMGNKIPEVPVWAIQLMLEKEEL